MRFGTRDSAGTESNLAVLAVTTDQKAPARFGAYTSESSTLDRNYQRNERMMGYVARAGCARDAK